MTASVITVHEIGDRVIYHAFDNGAWMAYTVDCDTIATGIISNLRKTVVGVSIPEGPWAMSGGKNRIAAHWSSISHMAASLASAGWETTDTHHLVAYLMAHATALGFKPED